MKISLKVHNKMKEYPARIVMILFVLFFIIACEKTNDSKYTPPADHTISKDGFKHKSGLEQPLINCISCHGSDLKGGTTGVSCFECHGKKW